MKMATHQAPTPEVIEGYLTLRGWKRRENKGNFSVWATLGNTELFVPQMPHARDYPQRAHEVLGTLSEIERRAPNVLLFDMFHPDQDVVRVRVAGQAAMGDSIPLDAGHRLFDTASGIMACAACAETGTKLLFDGRRVGPVTDYLKSLRLGQTEPGSFVLTILSPVRMPTTDTRQSDLPFQEVPAIVVDPFRRGVTRTLGRALVAVQSAVQRSTPGRTDAFEEVVDQGVSANLLEALGSAASIDRLEDLEVLISWAPAQSEPDSAPHHAMFKRAALETIGSAGATIRSRYKPRKDFMLQGYVRKLERPEDAFIGRVVIEGGVDGKMRKVSTELAGTDLAIAHAAMGEHRQSVLIECCGRLDRAPTGYILRDAHSARRVPKEELDEVDVERTEDDPSGLSNP